MNEAWHVLALRAVMSAGKEEKQGINREPY